MIQNNIHIHINRYPYIFKARIRSPITPSLQLTTQWTKVGPGQIKVDFRSSFSRVFRKRLSHAGHVLFLISELLVYQTLRAKSPIPIKDSIEYLLIRMLLVK